MSHIYEVSCSVTGLPIKMNDLVVLFLLEKNNITSSSIVQNVNEIYEPVFFPIFAKYDGLGGIHFIKKNKNTKLIEKKLGLKNIKDINQLKHQYYFMFVNHNIYLEMISFSIKENKGIHGFVKNAFISTSLLKILDFSFNEKEKTYEKNGFKVKYDGYSLHIVGFMRAAYNIRDFFEIWKEYTGEELDVGQIEKDVGQIENFDFIYEKVKERYENSFIEFTEMMSLSGSDTRFKLMGNYKDDIDDYFLRRFADYYRFSWYLMEINRFYVPSILSAYNMRLKNILEKSLEILKDK